MQLNYAKFVISPFVTYKEMTFFLFSCLNLIFEHLHLHFSLRDFSQVGFNCLYHICSKNTFTLRILWDPSTQHDTVWQIKFLTGRGSLVGSVSALQAAILLCN